MNEGSKTPVDQTAVVKTTEKAPIKKEKNPLIALLEGESFQNRILKTLPKHITPARMAFIAVACIRKNPKLGMCTQESFFGCMMTLSAIGLEPDGRKAHLIPYGTECTLIIDYKGLIELVYRSGDVSKIHADVVCRNDTFKYEKGEIKIHDIDFGRPRGDEYAFYCIITMKDGTSKCEVMSKDEVDKIRKRSKAGQSGPWVSDYNEMAKKTVFKRCFKWLPVSPEIKQAIDSDDKFDGVTIETKRVEKGSASCILDGDFETPPAGEE